MKIFLETLKEPSWDLRIHIDTEDGYINHFGEREKKRTSEFHGSWFLLDHYLDVVGEHQKLREEKDSYEKWQAEKGFRKLTFQKIIDKYNYIYKIFYMNAENFLKQAFNNEKVRQYIKEYPEDKDIIEKLSDIDNYNEDIKYDDIVKKLNISEDYIRIIGNAQSNKIIFNKIDNLLTSIYGTDEWKTTHDDDFDNKEKQKKDMDIEACYQYVTKNKLLGDYELYDRIHDVSYEPIDLENKVKEIEDMKGIYGRQIINNITTRLIKEAADSSKNDQIDILKDEVKALNNKLEQEKLEREVEKNENDRLIQKLKQQVEELEEKNHKLEIKNQSLSLDFSYKSKKLKKKNKVQNIVFAIILGALAISHVVPAVKDKIETLKENQGVGLNEKEENDNIVEAFEKGALNIKTQMEASDTLVKNKIKKALKNNKNVSNA